MDTTKKYLFHNIYGDADNLISTKDINTIPVAWGPDSETENNRNNILNQLGITVSCLPSLIYWKEMEQVPSIINGVNTFYTVDAHWQELRIEDLDKSNWNWEYINTYLQQS